MSKIEICSKSFFYLWKINKETKRLLSKINQNASESNAHSIFMQFVLKGP